MIPFVYYAKNGVFVIPFELQAVSQRVSTHSRHPFGENADIGWI